MGGERKRKIKGSRKSLREKESDGQKERGRENKRDRHEREKE